MPKLAAQIHRELARLDEVAWGAFPAELGRGRKKVYCILSAGREEFGRWLSESTLRDEMMVRVRAVAASSRLADESNWVDISRRAVELLELPPNDKA